MTNILITVPARKGSKGIPDKNMQMFGGRSLLHNALNVAKEVTGASIVLTTDYKTLFSVFTHRRPPELLTDEALAWDVWQDAASAARGKHGKRFDVHVYLEPTSPFRSVRDVEMCIDLINAGRSNVCTVSPAPVHPSKIFRTDPGTIHNVEHYNNKPRQLLGGQWYVKNGICYACSGERMETAHTMLDTDTEYVVIDRPVVNIDTPQDLLLARAMISGES